MNVITEIDLVRQAVDLLGKEAFASIGDILDESHRSMRDDFEISCPELDLAVETARSNGVRRSDDRRWFRRFGDRAGACRIGRGVSSAVSEAFRVKGFGSPDCFAVLPGAPACRDL